MATTFATRRISYRDHDGTDRTIPKGADLTKLKPLIPEQQIDDWRRAGMVGAKPETDGADASKAGAAKS